jgi:hypothetical protein
MPFQSEKQRRYLHANHPEIAKRWEKEYAYGGLLSLGNESIVDTTEEGNDISLVDDTSQGIERMFVKKGGQAIGGGTIQGEPRGDRTGFRNPHEETATAGGKSGYGGGSSNRERGIQQAYEVTGPAAAKERQREEERDTLVATGPGSDWEKYSDYSAKEASELGGYTGTKRGELYSTRTRMELQEAQKIQRAALNKWGLGELGKMGVMLAAMLAMGVPFMDAIKAVPKTVSISKEDLAKLVKESIPVMQAQQEHLKALDEYKTALLGEVDILNPNEMKSKTGNKISDITNEINELTKTREDTGDESSPVAPVTDEIEESTTYAWDMFTPRDQLEKAAYLDKLEEQAAALNPNKDDLIGEETSGLADLFTVKTQQ